MKLCVQCFQIVLFGIPAPWSWNFMMFVRLFHFFIQILNRTVIFLSILSFDFPYLSTLSIQLHVSIFHSSTFLRTGGKLQHHRSVRFSIHDQLRCGIYSRLNIGVSIFHQFFKFYFDRIFWLLVHVTKCLCLYISNRLPLVIWKPDWQHCFSNVFQLLYWNFLRIQHRHWSQTHFHFLQVQTLYSAIMWFSRPFVEHKFEQFNFLDPVCPKTFSIFPVRCFPVYQTTKAIQFFIPYFQECFWLFCLSIPIVYKSSLQSSTSSSSSTE